MKNFDRIGFLLHSAQSKPFRVCERHQNLIILAVKGLETAFLIDVLCAEIAVQHAQRQAGEAQVFKGEFAGAPERPCADAMVAVVFSGDGNAVVGAVGFRVEFVDHAFADDLAAWIKDQKIMPGFIGDAAQEKGDDHILRIILRAAGQTGDLRVDGMKKGMIIGFRI